MAASKQELGTQAYIFSSNKKKQDTDNSLMISAHGGPQNAYTGIMSGSLPSSGDYSWFPEFTVPASMELYFYGPHNVTLLDPSYTTILKKAVHPYEIIKGGQKSHNYGLWKWQGYHHSAAAVILGKIAQPIVDEGSETYQNILISYNWVATQTFDYMDLLSIRYRPFRWHTSLADVLKQLEEKYPGKYKTIHCNFCRGITGGHDAKTNPAVS